MNLYEISGKVAELKAKVDNGEISEDAFNDTLESLEINRHEKIENISNWSQENGMKIDALDKKIKEWTKEKKRLKNEKSRLDNYLLDDLKANGQKSYTLDNNLIKVRNTKPKVIIDDENVVPTDYVKTKTTKSIDKTEAYQALKNGEINGMHLEPNQSLSIK